MITNESFSIVVILPDLREATSPPIRLMSDGAGKYVANVDADLTISDAPGVRLHLTAVLGLTLPVPDVNKPGVIPETDA